MTRFIHTFGLLSIRGDSGSGSSADDDNESDFTDQQYEDSAATFGLGKRDLIRGADCPNAIDLEPRAMALTLSAITPAMIANDLFECGGELASYLNRLLCASILNRLAMSSGILRKPCSATGP